MYSIKFIHFQFLFILNLPSFFNDRKPGVRFESCQTFSNRSVIYVFTQTFAWNISAEFLVDFFWEPFQQVLPYADILFGNEAEAAAFARKNGWDDVRR